MFVSSVVSTSQPFDASLSQFAYPVLHVGMEHVEAAHVSFPFSVLQAALHAPQLFGSVVRFTHARDVPPSGGHSIGSAAFGQLPPQLVPSHVDFPFVGIGHTAHDAGPHELVDAFDKHVVAVPVPQLCVPAGQTQLPPLQTIPPMHVLPHAPQLFGSTERSWQAADPASALQRDSPGGHTQALLEQISVARHRLLQPPQFLASVAVSTQRAGAPHMIRVGMLRSPQKAQPPPTQLPVMGQTSPQLPQLFGSVNTSVQKKGAPASPAPMQTDWPVGQLQAPSTHVPPAAHVSPQLPQLLTSLVVWMQAPASPVPQKCSMPAHMQEPPWQGAPPGHTVPQLPQFFESLISLTHAPLHMLPAHASAPPSPRATPPSPLSSVVASTLSTTALDWNPWKFQKLEHPATQNSMTAAKKKPIARAIESPLASQHEAPAFTRDRRRNGHFARRDLRRGEIDDGSGRDEHAARNERDGGDERLVDCGVVVFLRLALGGERHVRGAGCDDPVALVDRGVVGRFREEPEDRTRGEPSQPDDAKGDSERPPRSVELRHLTGSRGGVRLENDADGAVQLAFADEECALVFAISVGLEREVVFAGIDQCGRTVELFEERLSVHRDTHGDEVVSGGVFRGEDEPRNR